MNFRISVFSVSLAIGFCLIGCGNNISVREDNMAVYRHRFEDIKEADSVEVACVTNAGLIEEYKKNYFLLVQDFMAGGFATQNNLRYLNDEYPQEYYEFCLEDLNDDGVPEFLLSYRYNGLEQTFWELYKSGKDYRDSYVGTFNCFDPESGILATSYGNEVVAVSFDGEKLNREFEYFVDYEESVCDPGEYGGDDSFVSMNALESEERYIYKDRDFNEHMLTRADFEKKCSYYYDNESLKLKGRMLTLGNVAEALDIDPESLRMERTIRAYKGYVRYLAMFQKMTDRRFYLVEVDDDDIPELLSFVGDSGELYYLTEGQIMRSGFSLEDDGLFYYFPHTGVMETECNAYGYESREYVFFNGESAVVLAKIDKEIKEPVIIFGVTGGDISGRCKYVRYLDGRVSSDKECCDLEDMIYECFDLEQNPEHTKIELKASEGMRYVELLDRLG